MSSTEIETIDLLDPDRSGTGPGPLPWVDPRSRPYTQVETFDRLITWPTNSSYVSMKKTLDIVIGTIDLID